MTLDLDELERKAKAASPYHWGDYYPGQAPKELVDLRNAADGAPVLALIQRVRLAEAAVPRCGCGATSSARGDPQCDGCGKDCYYCTCRENESATP